MTSTRAGDCSDRRDSDRPVSVASTVVWFAGSGVIAIASQVRTH